MYFCVVLIASHREILYYIPWPPKLKFFRKSTPIQHVEFPILSRYIRKVKIAGPAINSPGKLPPSPVGLFRLSALMAELFNIYFMEKSTCACCGDHFNHRFKNVMK